MGRRAEDRPFASQVEIGYQVLPGDTFAVASYVGPFGPTLEQAYGEMFASILRLERYTIIGLPAIEIYRTRLDLVCVVGASGVKKLAIPAVVAAMKIEDGDHLSRLKLAYIAYSSL